MMLDEGPRPISNMNPFDRAFERLVGHEGGFQADPEDRGNWTGGNVGKGQLKGTKYGISAMSYPHIDIENLSLDKAKSIYFNDYWRPVIHKEYPDTILFDLFDMAVNSGVKFANKTLQRALIVEPDGVIGPKTLAAVARIDPLILSNRLNAERLMAMTGMNTFSTYGRGWVRRVAQNILDANELGRI